LGNNCEVGLQLRRFGLMERDDFFIWHAAPFLTVTKLLAAEFADVGADNHLERPRLGSDMIVDRHYGLEIHSPFLVNGVDHFRTADHSRIYRFFSAALKRRAEAFLQHLRDGNVIYVCKYQDHTSMEDASILARLLREKAGHDRFNLVFVQERRAQDEEWSVPNVLPAYVEAFARWDRTTEYDAASWEAVFQQAATKIQGASVIISAIRGATAAKLEELSQAVERLRGDLAKSAGDSRAYEARPRNDQTSVEEQIEGLQAAIAAAAERHAAVLDRLYQVDTKLTEALQTGKSELATLQSRVSELQCNLDQSKRAIVSRFDESKRAMGAQFGHIEEQFLTRIDALESIVKKPKWERGWRGMLRRLWANRKDVPGARASGLR